MSRRRWGALLLGLSLAACGGAGRAGKVRFANQPPVERVNDRNDVAEKPANRPFARLLYHTDAPFFRRITLAMELPAPRRAKNVNALGEVPDSTWFTNRIGVRLLSPAEVARGPNRDTAGPDRSAPWQVVGSKVGGQSVGLLIKDGSGTKYLLKFDEPEYPVIETATDVVVQRLLWACGYNVPADEIVHFERSQLVLAPDAEIKDVFGHGKPMTVADLDEALSKVHVDPDGSYRGLVSKFLPGVPIGGFSQRGVRKDDPNDLIPHQHRRELRGLYVFYSWLQYTDAKENNTLDVWEADPADPDRHYVVHYLVDFGKSLGANGTISKFAADGHRYMVDLIDVPLSLFRFGLVKRPWEGTLEPFEELVGVGMFDVDHFEPGGFRPHDPYTPFIRKDVHDAFWAAKILAQLTPAQIRAAVEQGKYDDPRTVEYLVDTLYRRARKATRYWFEKTNPLANFTVEQLGDRYQLCFDDLSLAHQLVDLASAPTSYTAESFDFTGKPTGWKDSLHSSSPRMSQPGSGGEGATSNHPAGRACVGGFSPGAGAEGYTIIRVDTYRRGAREPVMIHLARDPATGRLRVIGVWRGPG